MDKKLGNNVLVGLFVALGFLVVVFILFNISGGKGVFTKDYTIYATFSHVKGLNYGSEVSLMGVRAGAVKKIGIAPNNRDLMVSLAISKEMRDRVRKDSVATIKTSGVLGDKYIEISIGSPTEPMLQDGDSINSGEAKDVFSKTGELVGEISKQFQKDGELGALLKNLNRIAANVATITEDLQREKGLWSELAYGTSGAKLNKSLTHLETILKRIEAGEGTLGSLINDPTVYEDLKAMMGGARRSNVLKYFMRQFIETSDKAEPPSSKPKGK